MAILDTVVVPLGGSVSLAIGNFAEGSICCVGMRWLYVLCGYRVAYRLSHSPLFK